MPVFPINHLGGLRSETEQDIGNRCGILDVYAALFGAVGTKMKFPHLAVDYFRQVNGRRITAANVAIHTGLSPPQRMGTPVLLASL
jgi:hypothetical protein